MSCANKFCNAIWNGLTSYIDFGGRTRRFNYWIFQLVSFLITLVLTAIFLITFFSRHRSYYDYYYDYYDDYDYRYRDYARSSSSIAYLVVLIILGFYITFLILPCLSSTVRRLHDTGRNGEYIFIALVPLFGQIALIYCLCNDSERTTNKYGPSEKYEQKQAFNSLLPKDYISSEDSYPQKAITNTNDINMNSIN